MQIKWIYNRYKAFIDDIIKIDWKVPSKGSILDLTCAEILNLNKTEY